MTSPAGVSAQDVLNFARSQLGDPYLWGATGPNAWDCSGLIQWAYRQAGISIPRTTFQMVADPRLQPITWDQLQPGDLIFSIGSGNRRSGHVQMYAGNNRIIQAGSGGVTEREIDPGLRSRSDELRRVPGVAGYAAPRGGAGDPDVLPVINPLNPIATAINLLNPLSDSSPTARAVAGLGQAMVSVAQSALSVGELAGLATRAFLPTNILRGTLFLFGLMFLIVGIWFIALEVRDK